MCGWIAKLMSMSLLFFYLCLSVCEGVSTDSALVFSILGVKNDVKQFLENWGWIDAFYSPDY